MSRTYTASGPVKTESGSYLVRLQYYDATGKRRNISRCKPTRGEAQEVLQDLIEKHTSGVLGKDRTFSALAEELKRERYAEPTYSKTGELKSGVRCPRKSHSVINRLDRFFGSKKLTDIKLADLERYKNERLKSVSITSVNRELSLMRTAFHWAIRNDYIVGSPFDKAERGKLINVKAEPKRTETISREQEEILLSKCQTERRRHLRAMIITMLDSGCRFGELLTLKWSDINFQANCFTVASYKGGNRRERKVPLSERTRKAFLEVRERPSLMSFRKDGMDAMLVFGVASNVQKSWNAVRKEAGLDTLRLHDLRHTFASRLAKGQMNIGLIAHVLGHSNVQTTLRYVNTDDEVLQTAREITEQRKA